MIRAVQVMRSGNVAEFFKSHGINMKGLCVPRMIHDGVVIDEYKKKIVIGQCLKLWKIEIKTFLFYFETFLRIFYFIIKRVTRLCGISAWHSGTLIASCLCYAGPRETGTIFERERDE